jgi:hypothetical protein
VGHDPVGASAGAGALDGGVDGGVGGVVGGVVGGAGDGACVGVGLGATVRGRPASACVGLPIKRSRTGPVCHRSARRCRLPLGAPGCAQGRRGQIPEKFRRSRVMNGPLHRLPSTGLRAGGRHEGRETTHR